MVYPDDERPSDAKPADRLVVFDPRDRIESLTRSCTRPSHIVVTVTHIGRPVAELRPVGRAPGALDELIRRRSQLPVVDVDALRREIDDVLDSAV